MVEIHLSGRGDLTAQIYRQLLDAIVDGRLRTGERLPSSRDLAERLDVARNTVASAYERLTAEGFLAGRVGAGTFVATPTRPIRPTRSHRIRTGDGPRPSRRWRPLAEAPTGWAGPGEPGAGAPFDFSVGVPDPRLFPLETWRRLVTRELRPAAIDLHAYADPSGHPGLRAAIARYFGVARSVRAEPDDILVTNGAQQALDLVARVLLEPGATVAVEEPGYRPARLLFQSLGARVVGVPVDGEGLDVDALPAGTRLVYVTPSHQFPLGTPMSVERRTALLEWARRTGAVVIEDDYDSEFRYSDRPLEPLQSLDRADRVVYVGSFSKTLLPLLRLGFLVAPAGLRPALRTAKRLTDWHTELTGQGALARFVDEGLLARHVRKATKEYGARRARIVAWIEGPLGRWLRLVPSAAGIHVCTRTELPVASVARAVAAVRQAGVAVDTLAQYCGEEPAQAGLVVGYGAVRPDRIDEGLRKIGAALESVATRAE